MESLAIVAALVIAYGAVSARVRATGITPPMLFVGAGLLLGDGGLGVLQLGIEREGVRILIEATLAIVLFVDAISLKLSRLVGEVQLPARLLGIGMPGTVVLGTAAALLLFDFAVWEAALLAAVLAPTDAALGQAVVSDDRVPVRIRETITVESGLNDGIALPLVTLFIGLAAGEEGLADGGSIVAFVVRQIGVGALAGIAVGFVGGRIIDVTVRRGWMDGVFRQLSTFSVALCAFAVAEQFGGNGFIATFVAGVAFGQAAADQSDGAANFAEDQGQLLTLLTFLVFGASVAGPALADAPQPQTLVYAVLSLTVVRMLPVAVALLGTGVTLPTMAFVGWFGPRGLASILFAVLIIEESTLAVQSDILTIVSWTVLLSVYAHGMSARPAAAAYARHVALMHEDRAEHRPQTHMGLGT